MARHLLLVVAVISVSSFELSHAAPLGLQDQYQAALQQVAELKGNGTFQDCCDVSKNNLTGCGSHMYIYCYG